MKNVKTLAAGAAMTLFLAMPALLVGCGMTTDEAARTSARRADGPTPKSSSARTD